MKLPRIRDLTAEQKKVYLYAPTDRHLLVNGPPGTGKTLIAVLRSQELQKRNVPFVLAMYNQVLARYTASGASDDSATPARTVLSWFRDWWSRSGLPPTHAARSVVLQTEYRDRAAVRDAGACWSPGTWQPWGRRQGVWEVDTATYLEDPARFARWHAWHNPPELGDGNGYSIDWSAVRDHVLTHDTLITDEALSIGSLLVDEGQDFPVGFYKTMSLLSSLGKARGVAHPLQCFVLADENQQITEQNSTLDEIASSLRIAPEHRYTLLDNFRNTREIAELARSFFADVGVLPRLPSRVGSVPTLELAARPETCIEAIRIWLSNHPDKEVGVLVFRNERREAVHRELVRVLGGMRNRRIVVQTYSWASRRDHPVGSLVFDHGDVVTVLNLASCKGLEFDAVFVIDPGDTRIGPDGPDRFKMQMFVATSRAREHVAIIDTSTNAAPAFLAYMPDDSVLARTRSGSDTAVARAAQSGGPASRRQKEGPASSSWETRLEALAAEHSLSVIDKRPNGGALWVDTGPQLSEELEALGFVFSLKKNMWWKS